MQDILRKHHNFIVPETGSLSNLENILSKLSQIPTEFIESKKNQEKKRIIKEALKKKRQIQFTYLSLEDPNRDKKTMKERSELRRVEPWVVFSHIDNEYLIGYCHLREAPRFFRLERAYSIQLLSIGSTIKIPLQIQNYVSNDFSGYLKNRSIPVEIGIDPKIRSYVETHLPIINVRTRGGELGDPYSNWLIVKTKIIDNIWFKNYIRSFGTSALILAPKDLAREYSSENQEIPLPDLYREDSRRRE